MGLFRSLDRVRVDRPGHRCDALIVSKFSRVNEHGEIIWLCSGRKACADHFPPTWVTEDKMRPADA